MALSASQIPSDEQPDWQLHLVNGTSIAALHALKPGDEILLGNVLLDLTVEESPQVSRVLRIDELKMPRVQADAASSRWLEALSIVHETSLDLVGEQPLQTMLEKLLARLHAFIQPTRGAMLLRGRSGDLEQVAVQTSQGRSAAIRLSRTMVEAAIERREAMLVNDPLQDAKLAQAPSLVLSRTSSIMTVPLEHEGEVVGLVYMDAGPHRAAFTEEDLTFVAAMGRLAAAKVRQLRMAEEVGRKHDLDKELALARQIQQRLLPLEQPVLEGFELFGNNQSCKQVSGDLFGFWPRPDGKLWVVIADVAGKGVGPGLLMATFQAYMQAWSESGMGPAELTQRISVTLGHRTTPNRYITAFLGLLDPATGNLESTNAGHNPVLLLHADGRRELLESQGFPLAIFPGGPYGQAQSRLEPGDLLVLYTDGIGEAADANGNDFGLEGLEAVVRAHFELPLPELYAQIQEALERHTEGRPLQDDRTLVILRRS